MDELMKKLAELMNNGSSERNLCMNELMNRLASYEIGLSRIPGYTYFMVALFISLSTENIHTTDRFFMGMFSIMFVLCLLASSFFNQRKLFDADAVEKNCSILGIIVALWSLQVLYFYHSLWVVFALGIFVPGIVIFVCNSYCQNTRMKLLVFIGYYMFIFFWLHIAFLRTVLVYVLAALIIWWHFTKCEEILDGEDADVIGRYYQDARLQQSYTLYFFLLLFAINSFFHYFNLNAKPEDTFFNPVFPLFSAMLILFIRERVIMLLEERCSGSNLANVFS